MPQNETALGSRQRPESQKIKLVTNSGLHTQCAKSSVSLDTQWQSWRMFQALADLASAQYQQMLTADPDAAAQMGAVHAALSRACDFSVQRHSKQFLEDA